MKLLLFLFASLFLLALSSVFSNHPHDLPIFDDIVYIEGEVSDEELSEIMEIIKEAGLGRLPSKTEVAEREK